MDNNSEAKQRNRRRKRAQRMQAIREKQDCKDDSGEEDENNGTKEKPQRPPCRRKKVKEKDFLAEEDIIDGFAILAFKTYEDLEVSGPLCVCVCVLCRSTRRRCRISATVSSSSWLVCCVLSG